MSTSSNVASATKVENNVEKARECLLNFLLAPPKRFNDDHMIELAALFGVVDLYLRWALSEFSEIDLDCEKGEAP